MIIRWTEDCGHLHRYMCTCSISILRWSERVKTSSYKYLDPRFLRCTSPMYEASVFNTVVLETSTAHFIAPSINCIQEKNICTTNSKWTPQRAKYFTLAKTPKERYSRHTRQILVEFVDTTDFNILKDVRVMTNRKYSYALKKNKIKIIASEKKIAVANLYSSLRPNLGETIRQRQLLSQRSPYNTITKTPKVASLNN